MSCTSLSRTSVSMSNLPVLLYLSVACCGSSVHHKTRYSLYIYLQHSTTYIHSVSRTRLFSPIARTHPLHFFPLHPHAWSSGQSARGVAEVDRKPRLTSWMASSQTDAISIHFPLHLPHSRTRALADSSKCGLLGEQSSQKFVISCLERQGTAEQNLKPLALSSAEKSVTAQIHTKTNTQTVTDISTLCLSACVDENDAVIGSPNVYVVEVFHHESWKSSNLGVKRTKFKVTRHKNSAGVGLCTLLSACFFWFTVLLLLFLSRQNATGLHLSGTDLPDCDFELTCRYSQSGTRTNRDGSYEYISQSCVFKLKPLQSASLVHSMAQWATKSKPLSPISSVTLLGSSTTHVGSPSGLVNTGMNDFVEFPVHTSRFRDRWEVWWSACLYVCLFVCRFVGLLA